MTRVTRMMLVIVLVVGVRPSSFAQQVIDPDFDTKVERPAYTDRHPAVLFDEAHNNYHTAGGRFMPFVALISNDGYTVTPGKKPFSRDALKGYDVLIIVNAQGAPVAAAAKSPEAANPAFEAAECDAVREWVEAGGAVLLMAKPYPWGAATERLASRLGVEMGCSTTIDRANSEPESMAPLVFSRDNGLLGDHPITLGRDESERVDRVFVYNGQSLQGPKGSVMLLRLSDSAFDRPVAGSSKGRVGPVAGRAQGLAFLLGKGRVVVLGEAAMLTAQLLGPDRVPFGMNGPGNGNRQLALNVMHWLSALKTLDAAGLAAKPGTSTGRATAAARPRAAAGAGGEKSEATKPAGPALARSNAAAARPAEPGRPLSTAEIAAESEASIALVSGEDSTGTGFLVRPGLLMTNSHVINDEYMTQVKVRFPSAENGQQGPFPAELVYEDYRRDLALLTVKSTLPPLRIAPAYTFRKGEDIVVIGNPGIGRKLVLENAISRGIMSTKATLNGHQFYQLGISVNPGNSGGPVFDSTGAVIGVVTRKSTAKEALAFCIPVEDVHEALKKAAALAPAAIDRLRSKHRLIVAVKELGYGGALYSIAITFHRRPATGPQGKVNVKNKRAVQYYDEGVTGFESKYLARLKSEVARVRDDPLLAQPQRDKVAELADNFDKYKALYDNKKAVSPGPNDPFPGLKTTHRRLLNELFEALAIDRPEYMIVFNLVPANRGSGDATPEELPAGK